MTEGGKVLFMGSYAGRQAYSSSLVYGVTKAAIHFLTKSLVKGVRAEGDYGKCNCSGILLKLPGMRTAHRKVMTESTEKFSSHRFGEIRDVAELAYCILTNGYMNGGSIVDIHGGDSMIIFRQTGVPKEEL